LIGFVVVKNVMIINIKFGLIVKLPKEKKTND